MSSSNQSTSALAPVAAWRRMRDALSFSSVRVVEDTVTHRFSVGHYSRIDGHMRPGEFIDSGVIHAGGRKWKLFYYPNGVDAAKPGQVAVGLMLMNQRSRPWNVAAGYKVSILDGEGNPVHSRTVESEGYFIGNKPREFHHLATVEQQRSVLRGVEDGSLNISCEITVPMIKEESRIRWYLRKLLN